MHELMTFWLEIQVALKQRLRCFLLCLTRLKNWSRLITVHLYHLKLDPACIMYRYVSDASISCCFPSQVCRERCDIDRSDIFGGGVNLMDQCTVESIYIPLNSFAFYGKKAYERVCLFDYASVLVDSWSDFCG